MKLKLDKRDFGNFLKSLMEEYDLFAPVQLSEGVSVFKKIDRPDDVDLSTSNPQKPVKEVFFPQSETLFRYEKAGKQHQITSTEEIERKRVILGARPCDIQAVSLIDQVFQERNIRMSITPIREKPRPSLGWPVIIPSPPAFVLP